MDEAPLMLGVSGLRGIAGKSLTPEVAVRFAAAFGTWLRGRLRSRADGFEMSPTVVIGRDGRRGGEWVHQAAIAGLLASGCDVEDLGVVTTPTVGIAAAGAHGGMVVTASHNPAEWNGLKCLVVDDDDERASAPTRAEADEIIGVYRSGPVHAASISQRPLMRRADAADEHRAEVGACLIGSLLDERALERLNERGSLGFRCVVDAVNCSGSSVSVPFLDEFAEVVGLACTGSGVFPHNPEPTRENLSLPGGLCDAVPGLKADVGFAQDPDADRLAIVDERGSYIGEEYTLAIAAESLLAARVEAVREPGDAGPSAGPPVIVVNLSTSRMIDDIAARYGAEVVRTPVGEANVVERMKQLRDEERDVMLGGEGNGGVIWPDVTYVRDSLSAMALTLSLMARTGLTVSQLVDRINSYGNGKGYTIVKHKAPLARKQDAEPTVRKIAEHYGRAGSPGVRVDTQDGVRIDWLDRFTTGKAWAHVRASNTEPIMRLIVEAPGEAEAAELTAELRRVIAG